MWSRVPCRRSCAEADHANGELDAPTAHQRRQTLLIEPRQNGCATPVSCASSRSTSRQECATVAQAHPHFAAPRSISGRSSALPTNGHGYAAFSAGLRTCGSVRPAGHASQWLRCNLHPLVRSARPHLRSTVRDKTSIYSRRLASPSEWRVAGFRSLRCAAMKLARCRITRETSCAPVELLGGESVGGGA